MKILTSLDLPSTHVHKPGKVTVAQNVSNYSSAAFYCLTFLYASYTLYLLLVKNDKSSSLITATIMIIYSSVWLAFFYSRDEHELLAEDNWTFKQKLYLVMANETPQLLVFISHWIIYY